MDAIYSELMELLICGAIYTVIVFATGFGWGFFIAHDKKINTRR